MPTQLNTYFVTEETDGLGQIFVTGILNVEQYNKVNVEIIQGPGAPTGMNVTCYMGKISGETLSQIVGEFPFGTATQIHTFEIVGPEFSLVLSGGPANTPVAIQAWVFLN
jgi:hypothetical protein